MAERIYLYPVWVRMWHGLNALLCLLLIVTGISMQYSNPEYPLIQFEMAVHIHDVCGIILSANYLFFVLGNIFTPNSRFYKTRFSEIFKDTVTQFKFYIGGLFRGDNVPFPVNKDRKFNPLQKVSYLVIMFFFVPIIIISGWGLFFPSLYMYGDGGVKMFQFTDLIHIIGGFIVSVFLIIHVYFCTLGKTPTSAFKSMMNGWHE